MHILSMYSYCAHNSMHTHIMHTTSGRARLATTWQTCLWGQRAHWGSSLKQLSDSMPSQKQLSWLQPSILIPCLTPLPASSFLYWPCIPSSLSANPILRSTILLHCLHFFPPFLLYKTSILILPTFLFFLYSIPLPLPPCLLSSSSSSSLTLAIFYLPLWHTQDCCCSLFIPHSGRCRQHNSWNPSSWNTGLQDWVSWWNSSWGCKQVLKTGLSCCSDPVSRVCRLPTKCRRTDLHGWWAYVVVT